MLLCWESCAGCLEILFGLSENPVWQVGSSIFSGMGTLDFKGQNPDFKGLG